MEYDLIAHGLRLSQLGTAALSWRDLLVIIRQAPQGSAVDRAANPEAAHWRIGDYLTAQAVDALQWLVWAKTEDGSKNRNKPALIPRPGLEQPDIVRRTGSAVSLKEMDALLGWSPTESPSDGEAG